MLQHSLTGLRRAIRKEWSLDRELSRRPELKMAIDTLKLLVGENNVRFDYVLPHIKSAGKLIRARGYKCLLFNAQLS